MTGGTRFWQKQQDERPLAVLLDDPDTVDAASAAFAAVGRSDAPWWPCAAVVNFDTVTVRMAGLTVPEPEAPWRAGHEPRIWTADRVALDGLDAPDGADPADPLRPGDGRLLVIGRYRDAVVFVDTTRAPGPIHVTGEPEHAGRVRELINGQLPEEERPQGGARWSLEVRDGGIILLGLAVAAVFSEADAQRALKLMLRAARRTARAAERTTEPPVAHERKPSSEPSSGDDHKPHDAPTTISVRWPYDDPATETQLTPNAPSPASSRPEPPASPLSDTDRRQQEALDIWLRQVRAAAERTTPQREPFRTEPQPSPAPRPADETAVLDSAWQSVTAPLATPHVTHPPRTEPQPRPTPGPTARTQPAAATVPAAADTEDWSDGFAVSSAE
jgi:hypothetical protein